MASGNNKNLDKLMNKVKIKLTSIVTRGLVDVVLTKNRDSIINKFSYKQITQKELW